MHLLLMIVLALGVATAQAAPALTEAEAVRHGMQRPEVQALYSARLEAAAGRVQAAGRWANPEIEFSSEDADIPGGTVEDRFYWVKQRLNLAGVPGLERDAALSTQTAENARTDLARRERAATIRRHYYDALAAGQHAEALVQWRMRLDELVGAVERRARAGDAARFDVLRLQKELALVSGDALDAEAQAASARDRLFSLLGIEPRRLAGELLPPSGQGANAVEIAARHPLLRALDAEARAAEYSATASKRQRWPELTVGLGRRELEEPGVSADGQLFSLGIEIPIFANGSGEAQTASARAHQLEAERAMADTRLAAESRSILRELEARRTAAVTLRERSGDSLAAIAESAYGAGELSVLELIDAHRTDLATTREAIRRAQDARQSYIELQSMRGEP